MGKLTSSAITSLLDNIPMFMWGVRTCRITEPWGRGYVEILSRRNLSNGSLGTLGNATVHKRPREAREGIINTF